MRGQLSRDARASIRRASLVALLARAARARRATRSRASIERRLGGPRAIAPGSLAGAAAMALADGRRRERVAALAREDARPRDGLALGLAQARRADARRLAQRRHAHRRPRAWVRRAPPRRRSRGTPRVPVHARRERAQGPRACSRAAAPRAPAHALAAGGSAAPSYRRSRAPALLAARGAAADSAALRPLPLCCSLRSSFPACAADRANALIQ